MRSGMLAPQPLVSGGLAQDEFLKQIFIQNSIVEIFRMQVGQEKMNIPKVSHVGYTSCYYYT